MKILLINNYYRYKGGEDEYVDLLVELLKRKNHSVVTYVKKSNEISDNFILKLKTAKGLFYNNQVIDEITEIISTFKPDIAHINNIYPLITPVVYEVFKKYNIPMVQTIHTYRFLCPKGTLYRNGQKCELCVNRNFTFPSIFFGCYHNSRSASLFFSLSNYYHHIRNKMRLIDKFIFPSKFARDYFVSHINIPVDKATVIPHFVNTPNLEKNIKKKDYFLYVGRLSEEKGIMKVLEIFSGMPKLKLVVIGDGTLKKNVDKYKKYSNISIKNYLPKEKVYQYMQQSLFTIIPSASWFEFGSYVMIESFANGTPVIVPEGGVFKERVINNKTGIFYKADDFNDLRKKLYLVMNNKRLIKEMSINARLIYDKDYTCDINYQSLLKVYIELIKSIHN